MELQKVTTLYCENEFPLWKFQINIIFKSSGLQDVIKGTTGTEAIPMPSREQNLTDYELKDAKAQKIIMLSIDKKLMIHIMTCENAKSMYEKLCALFERPNEQRKCEVLQKFYSYQYDKSKNMAENISTLENLRYQLNIYDEKISDNSFIAKIISLLPEKYNNFITSWESTPLHEKTTTNLTSRLLKEEERYKMQSKMKEEQSDVIAYKAHRKFNNYNKKEKTCEICKKTNHPTEKCFFKNKTYNKKIECTICKKNNHTTEKCFYRQNNHKKNNNNPKNNTAFMTYKDNKDDDNETITFIVDSGSSSHLTNKKNLLLNFQEESGKIGIAKAGIAMQSKGHGEIHGSECTLKQTIYVPDLTNNLMSVNAITNNGGKVIFEDQEVKILKEDELILKGNKEESGLYTVKINNLKQETSLLTDKINKAEEWHKKMGHPSIGKMLNLKKVAKNMNVSEEEIKNLNKTCEVCIMSKQVRKPFSTERQKATRPLQIIHTDICGPISPNTYDNKKYILTILDDYTHYTRVYLLENKYEAFEVIKTYIEEVEREKNLKVSTIRCDNGGEYTSNKMKNWCRYKGIILDYTIPYSPQLNGKAERLNRTVLEKVRALLFQSKEESYLWGEAAKTAAYLINRTPVETLNNLTPIEMWTNQQPDLSNIEIFGSEAYSKKLGHLQKLESRTNKMIMIGYAPTGYRLFDKEKQRVIIRRDIIFNFKENKEENCEENIKTNEDLVKNIIINEEDKYNNMEIEINKEENIQKQVEIPQEIEVVNTEDNNIQEIIEVVQEPITDNTIIQGLTDSTITQEVTDNNQNTNSQRPRRQHKIPIRYTDYAMLTFQKALTCPEKNEWIKAINSEKKSLQQNQVWDITDKEEAKGRKIIASMWIFKIKPNGKYKARLVAKGCQQIYGIDYEDTFSPVMSNSSFRILMAIGASKNLHIMSLDIKTAFLYGNLKEDIYMALPEGYDEYDRNTKVCKLKKSLYGLKQAPLNWNEKFTSVLLKNGLKQLKSDKCLFKNSDGTMMLGIHVDDGILLGDNKESMMKLINNLKEDFEMTYTENPETFLGIEITKTKDSIHLKQRENAENIIETFNMTEAKISPTPLLENNEIKQNDEQTKEKFPYREAIGHLMYLSNKTRPDLTYAVNYESRSMENPNNKDLNNVKRTMRYLKGTLNSKIKYNKDEKLTKLEAYCDADYAGDKETRKSTSGYIMMYCGGPVHWCTRKQPIVALSSCEAEYISAAECCKEILYIKGLIEELIETNITINLNIDNQSAIRLIENGVFNRRSKHIDVRYHFLHNLFVEDIMKISYCPTNLQLADILTKPLKTNKFSEFRDLIMQT